jgi:hypothetical protein
MPKSSQFSLGLATMAPVLGLGDLGRRLLQGGVGLFAVLGFVYVPLGRHTGLEHARAVLGTPAARAAVEDVTLAVLRLRQTAVELVAGRQPVRARSGEEHGVRPGGVEPRPVPPKLK